MLKNFRVGQKITAIVVLVGAILASLLVLSYLAFIDLRQGLDEVKNEGVPNAIVAKDMQMQVVQIQQWLTDIAATRGLDGLDDGFKEAEAAHQLFLADLAIIRQSYVNEGDSAGVAQSDQIGQRMISWYETGKKMAQAYIDGGPAAGNPQMAAFDKESSALQAVLEPLIKAQVDEAANEIGLAVATSERVQKITLAGIILAVLILTLGGIILGRGVVAPLNHMSSLMAELVARKDFSVKLDSDGRDEIAEASRSFNALVTMLRGMLQELNGDVHRLDDTAAELAAAIGHSSHSSSAASQSATTMAAAVEEMSVSLDQMRDNTRAAQAVVSVSSQHSEEGGRVIGAAIADMHRITSAVQQVSDVIGTLGDQTSRISSIVGVIRDVADQTNLLALNAAIEAARAGEQGRGFAVVADEVRKLAERTASATGEIGMMIAAIQNSSKTAVDRMTEAVSQADAGAHLANEAGQSIEAIRSGANQVATAFSDIANAISEQSSAGQLIAQQVEQVAQASDENSHAVGQTADVARNLELLSHEMRRRIDQFKL
jgi:methyl-accepting chemotaxis protein